MKSPNHSPELSICPCCGVERGGDSRAEACHACGARAIGPPLVRPEHELPAYGLTFAVFAVGALLVAVFAVTAAVVLFGQKSLSLSIWSLVAASETAAWHLKWIVLPLSFASFLGGARALMHVSRAPSRFACVRLALGGLAASALLAFGMTTLIGVTVPERLRQRELAREAARSAEAYDVIRTLLEYQQQYGTLPSSAKDLQKLPDPDGSVARAAAMLAPTAGQYEPESTIASLPTTKARGRRATSVTVRPVSLRAGADDLSGETLSFTNYTLRLPGADKKLGTADDVFVRDGMIVPAPPTEGARRAPISVKPGKP